MGLEEELSERGTVLCLCVCVRKLGESVVGGWTAGCV